MSIPVDRDCTHCGALTWREGRGAADRFWLGGYACRECAGRLAYRGGWLVSPRGHVEYNAGSVVGTAAARLTPGRWYTPQELAELCGRAVFLRESPNAVEKGIKRWRFER